MTEIAHVTGYAYKLQNCPIIFFLLNRVILKFVMASYHRNFKMAQTKREKYIWAILKFVCISSHVNYLRYSGIGLFWSLHRKTPTGELKNVEHGQNFGHMVGQTYFRDLELGHRFVHAELCDQQSCFEVIFGIKCLGQNVKDIINKLFLHVIVQG